MKGFFTRLIALSLFIIFFALDVWADPILINLSPNRGRIGSAVTMTARYADAQVRDNNKVYINNVLAPVRRVYAVTESKDLYKILFTVPPNVVEEAFSSPMIVPVVLEVNGASSNSLDFTLLPGPMITDITPSSGVRGDSLDVTITTVNTRFGRGRIMVDMGSGITVSKVKLKDPHTVVASIEIADDAELGLRDVTIRAGRSRLTKIGGFTVTAPADQATGLTLNVNPVPSPVFSKSVTISGSVNLAAPSINGTQTDIPAIVTGIFPSSAAQGQELLVEIKGTNTHFSEGVSQVSFGPGIEVLEANVTSPTSIMAKIRLSPSAEPGKRHVIVVTNNEEASSVVVFNVLSGTMTVKGKVIDDQGNPIVGAVVSIKGLNLRATTDSNGFFVLNSVPSGTQKLIINAQNFAPVEINIDGKNGDVLDLASSSSNSSSSINISLERRAAPPSDPNSATIYSALSHGANRLFLASPNIEKAKQLIMDTIIAVGGKDLGVVDEQGRQLNPKISGNGIVSLTSEGLDQMAKQWVIEKQTYSILNAFIFFNSIVGWEPKPPDFLNWIVAFNKALVKIWQQPSAPGNSLFVVIFNKGSLVSDTPPKLSPETRLNPLQMYLLVNSFVAYLDKKFFPSGSGSVGNRSMFAELTPNLRTTMGDMERPTILLADGGGNGNNNGSSGSNTKNEKKDTGLEDAYDTVVDNIKGTVLGSFDNKLIENIFDIDTSFPDARTARAFLVVEGLEKAMAPWSLASDFIKGTVSGLAGSALQNIYKPLLNMMRDEIKKAARPTNPRIVAAIPVKTVNGMNTILLFNPSRGDHGQKIIPKFYYAVYRQDDKRHIEKLILKPSSEFKRTKDGYLVFVDDSPPIGVVTYYLQSFIKRQNSVPPHEHLNWGLSLTWDFMTSALPAGGYVLNLLKDTLDMAEEIYRGLILQKSNLSAISVVIYPVSNPYLTVDIAVDRFYEQEYVSVRNTSFIYHKTEDGWKPLVKTQFASPYQKGLAVDSQGWLYVENAASESRFGGTIWGFKDPYNYKINSPERFYLGRTNYVSNFYTGFRTKACNISDLYIGRFSSFINSPNFDPESIAIADVASQSIKLLDRRKGRRPKSYFGNIARTIFRSDEGIITPFSRIAQNPLDAGQAFYLTSYHRIYYFEIGKTQYPADLVSKDNTLFNMLSDLVFDDIGNLYFLDNQIGKLFMIPKQVVEAARFFNTPVSDEEIIELPYTFSHPSSIEISADENFLLVGDEEGIHRIQRFVAVKSNAKCTVSVFAPGGGVEPALRYKNYILLPPDTSKIMVSIQNGSERVINLYSIDSIDSIDCQPLPEISEDMLNKPELVQQQKQDIFEFNISVPSQLAGKVLVKNIKIPCSRVVPKGQEVTLPDPTITDELIIPLGEKISPLILFSPVEVNGNGIEIDIKGIIKDANVASIKVYTDSNTSQDVSVIDNVFSFHITTHTQANVFWIKLPRQGQSPLIKQVVMRDNTAPKVTISGIVVDSITNQPVRNARIYIPEIEDEIYTDWNGYYRVTVPAGQNVTFKVSE